MAGKRSETSPVGSPSSGNISDKDQDRFLPIANVSRIMKKSLPANAKISKEAKETVQECVSEFISFITGEASDKCQREKRKTINGDDLLWAMTTLGFDNYIGPLKVYLNKYRETEGDKMINSSSSIAGQQDLQSPPTKDNYNNHGVGDDGYYSFGAQIITTTPNSFGDHGRVIGYGENMNMVANAFNMGNIQEIGDGYGNRPVSTHLHHGVEW